MNNKFKKIISSLILALMVILTPVEALAQERNITKEPTKQEFKEENKRIDRPKRSVDVDGDGEEDSFYVKNYGVGHGVSISPLAFTDEHIFSKAHRRLGIMNFGNSKQDIIDKGLNIIREAFNQIGVKQGPLQIKTTMNGYKAEVRIFIRGDELINADIVPGHSNRDMGNTIYIYP